MRVSESIGTKELKWCIKKQAAIHFIVGAILVPICLRCADTRTTCKAKKTVGRSNLPRFLILRAVEKIHGFFHGKRRQTT